MKIEFSKYQGTGNDFIIINNSTHLINHNPELAKKLCDRHFGIGSDGLIIIEKSAHHDFNMTFYNPDGSESFCGNGSRCAFKFAIDQKIINKNEGIFISTDGVHRASYMNNIVNLEMHEPTFIEEDISGINYPCQNLMVLNTGSPHLVIFLKPYKNLADLDVKTDGAFIRYSAIFNEKGININFVNIIKSNHIEIRTYERGVENETLSCGTGVTASALAYHAIYNKTEEKHAIGVNTKGGNLIVNFEFNQSKYSKVELCGPAQLVYSGHISI